MANTGYQAYTTLEQYYVLSGLPTGVTKPNDPGDPDYVAPVLNLVDCPLPTTTTTSTTSTTSTSTTTSTTTLPPTTTSTTTSTTTLAPTTTSTTSTTTTLVPTTTSTTSTTTTLEPTTTSTTTTTTTLAPADNYYFARAYVCDGSCNYAFDTFVKMPGAGVIGKFYREPGPISLWSYELVNTTPITTGTYLSNVPFNSCLLACAG